MWHLETPSWSITVRTVLVYLLVLVGLRLMGKRELGQMTVFDLVLILLIANAVQNAMVGPDTSLTGGILAAGVLLVANRGVSTARLRTGAWERLLEGTPTILIQDGHYVEPALRKEGIDHEEVAMVLREHGLESLASVKLAVLETDGSISVVPMSSPVIRSRRRVRQMRKR